jgi:hypothetical protein
VLVTQKVAEVIVGLGEVLLDSDSLTVRGNGLITLALGLQGAA